MKKQAAEIEKMVRNPRKPANQETGGSKQRRRKEAKKIAEAMRKGDQTKKSAMIELAKPDQGDGGAAEADGAS